MGALVVLLLSDLLFRGRVLFERDLHVFTYPRAESLVRVLAGGSLPLWNPWVSFGEPLLANPISQVLYPTTWLHLVMSPWHQYTAVTTIHLLFTACATYALGRALELSAWPSFLGAAVWLLSGPLLSLLDNAPHFVGAAWVPCVLLGAERLFQKATFPRVALCGILIAGQLLTGSAEMAALTALGVALQMLRHLVETPGGAWRVLRMLAAITLAAVIGLALAAALWISTLDLLARSSRPLLSRETTFYWSLHPLNLAQAVIPVPLDDLPLHSALRQRLFEGREPFLASIYLGLPALALMTAAFRGRFRRIIVWLAAMGAVGLMLALGRHAGADVLLATLLPPAAGLRYPVKAMVLVGMAWALLVGFGFEAVAGREIQRRRTVGLALPALVTAAVLSGAFACWFHADAVGARLLASSSAAPSFQRVLAPTAGRLLLAGVLSCAALLLMARLARHRSPAWAPCALALAVVGDLFWAHRELNRTADAAWLAVPPPALRQAAPSDRQRLYVYDYLVGAERHLGHPPYLLPPRTDWPVAWLDALALRAALYPNTLGQWGIESSYDLDHQNLLPVPLAQLSALVRASEGTPAHLRLLQIGNVGRVVALHAHGHDGLTKIATLRTPYPEPLHIFDVPGPLPRALPVSGARVVDGEPALRALVDPSFDPWREVLLAAGVARAPTAGFRGSAWLSAWRPDHVSVEATLNEPGYLLLLDTYDPGWRATVDGRPSPVLRANVAFRAVSLGAGRHLIEQVYRPRSVMVGATISGLALFALTSVGLAARTRARR